MYLVSSVWLLLVNGTVLQLLVGITTNCNDHVLSLTLTCSPGEVPRLVMISWMGR